MAVKSRGRPRGVKLAPEPIREELGKSSATADSVAAVLEERLGQHFTEAPPPVVSTNGKKAKHPKPNSLVISEVDRKNDKGKIIEAGRHEEYIAEPLGQRRKWNGKLYYYMWRDRYNVLHEIDFPVPSKEDVLPTRLYLVKETPTATVPILFGIPVGAWQKLAVVAIFILIGILALLTIIVMRGG